MRLWPISNRSGGAFPVYMSLCENRLTDQSPLHGFRHCTHRVRAAIITAGTPTPMPIFASVDSPLLGFSDDGGVVAVEVAEAELVLDVVARRVSNDVGIPVLYTIYDDAVSSISSDVGTISVPMSLR